MVNLEKLEEEYVREFKPDEFYTFKEAKEMCGRLVGASRFRPFNNMNRDLKKMGIYENDSIKGEGFLMILKKIYEKVNVKRFKLEVGMVIQLYDPAWLTEDYNSSKGEKLTLEEVTKIFSERLGRDNIDPSKIEKVLSRIPNWKNKMIIRENENIFYDRYEVESFANEAYFKSTVTTHLGNISREGGRRWTL